KGAARRAALLRGAQHPRSRRGARCLSSHRRSRVGCGAHVAPPRAPSLTMSMQPAAPNEGSAGASPPMTPERWRLVDEILRGALECEPDRRVGFVLNACGVDETLRREITSLL